MIISRIILDGLAMSLFFNFGVGLFSFILPQAYSTMFPKEIKGAENCKAWNLGEWMKAALPEHLLFWPIIFCPIAGLITAGIAILLSHIG